MHLTVQRSSLFLNDYILYDSTLLPQIERSFFVPDYWKERDCLSEQAQGRGDTFAFHVGQKCFYLRHYRRGGIVAHVLHDTYIWTGLQRTRAWRELSLLQAMYAKGLPVPRPAAAHVQRKGPVYYADIITQCIDHATPLADIIVNGKLQKVMWPHIGMCLRRFHVLGIVHADLNAHNILIDDREKVWLIDFDKGFWSNPSLRQQQSNLKRLHRSLHKIWPDSPTQLSLHHAWKLLLQGYSRI